MVDEEKCIRDLCDEIEEQDDHLVHISMELADLQVRFKKLETYIFNIEKIKI